MRCLFVLLGVGWFAECLVVVVVINSVGFILVVSGVLFHMIGCYVCGLVWLLFCLLGFVVLLLLLVFTCLYF